MLYNFFMSSEPILIQIDWVFFLGIFGALIAIAWYTGSRFKGIETNIDWLKEAVKDLANDNKVGRDNRRLNVIGNASPLRLLAEGVRVLQESGMKAWVDRNSMALEKSCGDFCSTSAYEIQERVFELFDNYQFDSETDKLFKDYAFKEGMNVETIRRIGAIYYRDICLSKCELNPTDIDATKPQTQTPVAER